MRLRQELVIYLWTSLLMDVVLATEDLLCTPLRLGTTKNSVNFGDVVDYVE